MNRPAIFTNKVITLGSKKFSLENLEDGILRKLVPAVEVKPTIEGIKPGKDERVEKAMDMIIGKNIQEKKKGFLP